MAESKNTQEVIIEVDEPQIPLQLKSQHAESEIVSKTNNNSLRMLSLFSGCGGMDLGFEGGFSVLENSINKQLFSKFVEKKMKNGFVQLRKTKFITVFANDILDDARRVWVNYFSKRGHNSDIYRSESIVDLVKMHNNGINVFPTNVDIVTGGFPCQDFSIAGKRNGFNSHKSHNGERINEKTATSETRGQLYMWMKQVIELTAPKMFIAENVKGLVNLSNVKEIIQSDFSAAGDNGYIVLEPQVLHAANYGVPQSRERVIFIGIKKSALNKKALFELQKNNIPDSYNPYPTPTHTYSNASNGQRSYVSLRELFQNLVEPEETEDLSQMYYSQAKYMGSHCQGQTEIKLDGIAPTIRAEHHGNIEFRRLSVNNGGNYQEELKAGLKERRLTPRECALIQTFPPDYEFVIKSPVSKNGSFHVSPSKAYKIIGNAVPPLLAYNLARRIEEVWPLYFNPTT